MQRTHRPAHRAVRLACVALLAVLTESCSQDAAGPAREPVASVTITPTSAELGIGATAPFQATVKDGVDRVLGDRRVVWTSSDPAIVSVSDVGVATAKQAGTAQIAATSEGKFAIAIVTVAAPVPPPPPARPPEPAASVRIVPEKAELKVGETIQLRAVAYDRSGAVLTGRHFAWVSSKPSVATVDADGRVKAVAKGDATITASSEGKAGTSKVEVSKRDD